MQKEEKKVEYLELIYDLIFVYIIGRNNSLLHNIENGFVSGSVLLAYILCSLAIIQIWNFSTFYTNLYGRNNLRDHISMFLNMYLLYYIGEGTRLHWESFQMQYHLAWALILINIGVGYLIELPAHRDNMEAVRTIKGMMIALFGEAAIVLIAIPIFQFTGVQLAGVAILYGILATHFFADRSKTMMVDFSHLSERAMLYVVFTFGEMIIAIASYFEGGFDTSSVYFSTMSFLIVVGLFLCYEVLYDRIIDREQVSSGMNYMMIHIFLVFGMNIITTSLEFMRNTEVRLFPKMLLLIGAFLLLFGCLFLLLTYAKSAMKRCSRFILKTVILSFAFAGLMIILRGNMYLNILVTVLYVFAQFGMIYKFSRQ
ncbi:MAG: low temperature requirement protein A [Clostridia bacterium]|nr:low temperature requirement protein A [Clostridia bacterium]